MKTPTMIIRNMFKGFPIFQYLAMLTGTLNLMSSGMHYGWPSPFLPKLLSNDSHIPMTNNEGSWVAITMLLGTFSGTIFGGLLLDRIGRKHVILLTSIPSIISWIMLAYAKSVIVLLIARYFAGISDGLIFCSLFIYFGEIFNPTIRGCLGSTSAVIWILGILITNVLGSYLTLTETALISLTIPMLLLLTFPWMPESPYFLLMKGKKAEAKESLMIFKGVDDVEEELDRLTLAVEEQNSNTGRYLDLFTVKSNRKALYIMMGSRAVQQFSGTVAIIFYAQIIFKEAGVNSISPTVASIIYFGVQFLSVGISSTIVDKKGRRPLMIVSIIGSGIALVMEGCYFYFKNLTTIDFSIISLVALIFYAIMYSFGLQSIPLILLGELFPTNVKAFAISFSIIYYSIITTIVSKFFQVTKDSFGIHVPFFVFTGCCVLGLLFILFFLPETKGKTLEQIQDKLKKENK